MKIIGIALLVLAAAAATNSNTLYHDGIIAGVVYDSINARPLDGAIVHLSGTTHTALTNDAGRFQFENIPSGRYTATFSHPSLDSIPARPKSISVNVTQTDTAHIQLGVPALPTVMAAACPMLTPGERSVSAVVFGTVRDKNGNALSGARVRAQGSGLRETRTSGNMYADQKATFRTETDAAGYYLLCGLPKEIQVDVQAIAPRHSGVTRQFAVTFPPYRRVDFTLK
jgi:hypothetical protein